MLRMARNAPIFEPTPATQVLNDTCSAAGAVELALPCPIGAAGTRADALDMRRSALNAPLAHRRRLSGPSLRLDGCRWMPRRTFRVAAGRAAVGGIQDVSSPGCAGRSW